MSSIGDRLRALAKVADEAPAISCVGVICTAGEEVALSCIDPNHPELMQIRSIGMCLEQASRLRAEEAHKENQNERS